MDQARDFDGKYFKPKVVRDVCKISARQLDYWIVREVVKPSCCYRLKKDPRRVTYLFTFRDIVQIRIVKSLRDQGISLQEIRKALDNLREKYGDTWQKAWLAVFDKQVFFVDSNKQLESLSKKDRGQLVFSVIAMGQAQREVATLLAETPAFDEARYPRGHVCSM